MANYLSADEILNSDDTIFFDVECPEWANKSNKQGLVRCRTLTAEERDKWEQMMDPDQNKGAKKNRANARAWLVSRVIVDEIGSRIFQKEDQIIRLGRKNVAPVQRIFERVLSESKVSQEDLEVTEGNFEETRSSDIALV